ncbi:putative short-chain dehydrogenase [Colletotrichum kahawae]|uniref:Short-chain dehydrogenase n=1 Tax=Colletotrichum kahawae TaxID=34407 RepID=A0AAD9XX39_COLKA|nr:putative short-chain dehydrogenase [Colletotrichum kahawae]
MASTAPYANEHRDTNGPGDARPNALKIIRDEALDGRLQGKVCLITGGTAGIGLETARAMHATGADVYITGRDTEKGVAVADSFASLDGKPGKVVFLQMSLDSVEEVSAAAAQFLSMSENLNILICNAGTPHRPALGLTKDGFEKHFGVNYVAQFALFQALRETLIKSASPGMSSRVVVLASLSHQASSVNFEDINFTTRDYNPMLAYGASKTACIWMANEIERRYGNERLHATSVHPGAIHTEAARHNPAGDAVMLKPEMRKYRKSPEQGAATTIWAAVGKQWENRGGRYLAEVQEAEPLKENDASFPRLGYAAHAYDMKAEQRLWDMTVECLRTKQ